MKKAIYASLLTTLLGTFSMISSTAHGSNSEYDREGAVIRDNASAEEVICTLESNFFKTILTGRLEGSTKTYFETLFIGDPDAPKPIAESEIDHQEIINGIYAQDIEDLEGINPESYRIERFEECMAKG